MARARRIPPATVIEQLLAEPESFDLIQAVRVLERRWRVRQEPRHEQRGAWSSVFGDERDVPLDAVRFLGEPSLKYPIATVTRATAPEGEGPVQLTVALFGLIGPLGVMPYGYTNLATQSLHEKNPAFAAFLDIFQHRAVTQFYRASTKYRLAVSHEQRRPKAPDPFATALRALVGLSPTALHDCLAVADDVILHHAGLFAAQSRPMSGLEALLVNELAHDVSILSFVGGWLGVAPSEQTRLPFPGAPGGLHCRLDSSAMLGSRAWVAQDCFRVVIGPVDRAGLQELLPGGPESNRIVDLVRLYCGLEFDFEINVIIKAGAVPPARLAGGSHDPGAARLGQTAWVLSAPSPIDRSDAIFPAGGFA
ncbi:type VI secretion system baseplate subunit TssG [Xanthobacter sp. DSM 24535]|uniref:type VI secretion system baseplate subunit TssG n=1 Tax=Roseixanthobacter psychrophilus TaxID=3119917 RepID=UPI00372BFE04